MSEPGNFNTIEVDHFSAMVIATMRKAGAVRAPRGGGLFARNGHRRDAKSGCNDRASDARDLRDGVNGSKHLVEVRRNRDFGHGLYESTVLDPETRRTARKITGNRIEAEPHHVRNIEAPRRALDQGLFGVLSWQQNEIAS